MWNEWFARRRRRVREKRIQLLSAELDVQRAVSIERSRSIESKASHVVVVAGVLVSVAGPSLVSADTCYVGIVPLVLTVVAVIESTFALWPRGISVPSAREMVDRWADAQMSSAELEDFILEVKAKEIVNRDELNEKRAKKAKCGMRFIVLALIITILVAILNSIV